jgi:hypothetical protein
VFNNNDACAKIWPLDWLQQQLGKVFTEPALVVTDKITPPSQSRTLAAGVFITSLSDTKGYADSDATVVTLEKLGTSGETWGSPPMLVIFKPVAANPIAAPVLPTPARATSEASEASAASHAFYAPSDVDTNEASNAWNAWMMWLKDELLAIVALVTGLCERFGCMKLRLAALGDARGTAILIAPGVYFAAMDATAMAVHNACISDTDIASAHVAVARWRAFSDSQLRRQVHALAMEEGELFNPARTDEIWQCMEDLRLLVVACDDLCGKYDDMLKSAAGAPMNAARRPWATDARRPWATDARGALMFSLPENNAPALEDAFNCNCLVKAQRSADARRPPRTPVDAFHAQMVDAAMMFDADDEGDDALITAILLIDMDGMDGMEGNF